jgi:hypothetical protein
MKQQCTKIDQASDIVLEILDRFVDDKIIQLCGWFVLINCYLIDYKE